MSEIDKRIATTFSGWPTAADAEATRIADLRAVKVDLEALASRVAALEARCEESDLRLLHAESDRDRAESIIDGSWPESDAAIARARAKASPAPPAPLVEKICLIFHKQQSPTYPARCEMAKEALLVAAEELLEPLTEFEKYEPNVALRARLARAKEAAK